MILVADDLTDLAAIKAWCTATLNATIAINSQLSIHECSIDGDRTSKFYIEFYNKISKQLIIQPEICIYSSVFTKRL